MSLDSAKCNGQNSVQRESLKILEKVLAMCKKFKKSNNSALFHNLQLLQC